ncbi:MAG: alpha/beta hydrolase family protein, partial [Paracoccaceae bacterium]
ARGLAEAGYVVIGAHHHGNTAREPDRPEGFLCWWERAHDLSVLLSRLSSAGFFAGRLDLGRVAAAGFSLGGHTVLALVGAKTAMDRYQAWAPATGLFTAGPREMPDAGDHIPHLLASSAVFRASWARQGDSFLDPRIGRIVAIAPAPPVRGFDESSVASISIPVTLMTGEADTEAPSPECADWLGATNSGFRRVSLGADVGHYTFFSLAAGEVTAEEAFLFADRPGVNRQDVHRRSLGLVLAALAQDGGVAVGSGV